VRLSSRGGAIWPCPEPVTPKDRCRRCGGLLEFGLQLMPPLMPMLQKAASWLNASEATEVEWDWVTIAVFVCSGRCSSRIGVAEEHLILGNEQSALIGSWSDRNLQVIRT